MREEYDFSKSKKNPYGKQMKQQVTLKGGYTMSDKTNNNSCTTSDLKKGLEFGINSDPFFLIENIEYLESLKNDIDAGRAHFAEHELLEE